MLFSVFSRHNRENSSVPLPLISQANIIPAIRTVSNNPLVLTTPHCMMLCVVLGICCDMVFKRFNFNINLVFTLYNVHTHTQSLTSHKQLWTFFVIMYVHMCLSNYTVYTHVHVYVPYKPYAVWRNLIWLNILVNWCDLPHFQYIFILGLLMKFWSAGNFSQ